MLKQEKYWRNNCQYYMAKECGRRAICLQNENIGGYDQLYAWHNKDWNEK